MCFTSTANDATEVPCVAKTTKQDQLRRIRALTTGADLEVLGEKNMWLQARVEEIIYKSTRSANTDNASPISVRVTTKADLKEHTILSESFGTNMRFSIADEDEELHGTLHSVLPSGLKFFLC